MRRVILLLAILAAFVSVTSAQARFSGKVVEVIDGRTMVLETNAGRITARLQFVETPEPEQSLHATVREHLSNLSFGKLIEFTPSRIADRITIGRALIDGVDLSAQLIRDGAAWHEPASTSGQPQQEAAEYASHQRLAKGEKRGVWAVADLRTPWELRAERQAALDRADQERRASQPSKVGVSQFQAENRAGPDSRLREAKGSSDQIGLWSDVFAGKGKDTYGLHTYSDPQGRFRVVFTSPSFLEFSGTKESFKVEYRIAYFIANAPSRFGSEFYTLYVRSMKDDYRFEKHRNNLVITTDNGKLYVGSPYTGATSSTAFGNHEFFFYRLTRAQVAALAKASTAHFKIDAIAGSADRRTLDLFKQLGDSMK